MYAYTYIMICVSVYISIYIYIHMYFYIIQVAQSPSSPPKGMGIQVQGYKWICDLGTKVAMIPDPRVGGWGWVCQ